MTDNTLEHNDTIMVYVNDQLTSYMSVSSYAAINHIDKTTLRAELRRNKLVIHGANRLIPGIYFR